MLGFLRCVRSYCSGEMRSRGLYQIMYISLHILYFLNHANLNFSIDQLIKWALCLFLNFSIKFQKRIDTHIFGEII